MGGGPPLRSILYYTNWSIYARSHLPQHLPLNHTTHVLYTFANVAPETGTVSLTDSWSDTEKHYPPGDSWNDEGGPNVYGNIKQLFLLKKRNRKLKVLLSVGGWTYSGNFRAMAARGEGRAEFARSVVRLVEDCGFDGVDVDWEYPADAAQGRDYVLLLRETKRALDHAAAKRKGGCRFLLSIACPAGEENYKHLDIRAMDPCLDFWNLMAYDYAGSWDSRAAHQSNLFPCSKHPETTPFSTAAAVDFYTQSGGVHPSKLVLGMPLYGRAFTDTKGPGHSFHGTGEGSWENGVWDYKALPRGGGAVVHEDCEGKDACGASWSYCPQTKTMVSYDTVGVVERKARFVRQRGLGGGMWWESSGDKPVGEGGSLVETFVHSIGGRASLEEGTNCLDYPESKYENLRKGFPGEGEQY